MLLSGSLLEDLQSSNLQLWSVFSWLQSGEAILDVVDLVMLFSLV